MFAPAGNHFRELFGISQGKYCRYWALLVLRPDLSAPIVLAKRSSLPFSTPILAGEDQGVLTMEMNCTELAPLVSLCLIRVETEGLLD